jgi:hypothetical protein
VVEPAPLLTEDLRARLRTPPDAMAALYRDLPKVALAELDLFAHDLPPAERGTKNRGLSQGALGSTRILVKVLDDVNFEQRLANTTRSALWVSALETMGLGPRLLGVGLQPGLGPALVMELGAGRLWKSGRPPFALSPTAKARAKAQLAQFERICSTNDVKVLDLQFLLTESGALLIIDPIYFQLVEPGQATIWNSVEFGFFREDLEPSSPGDY